MKMIVNIQAIKNELKLPVVEICNELGYAISEKEGILVRYVQGEKNYLRRDENGIVISCTRKNTFFRLLSMLPSFLESGENIQKENSLQMLCFMIDLSRNAVWNMNTAKKMVRKLALMGYNTLMLYTEDTYENPHYPYFGYMRGRLTENEMREIDDYAFQFGIEVIPCIQTLAHLATTLRWPEMADLKDTDAVLLSECEPVYSFIESCLQVCNRCFRSKRVHIGMDEAWDLGSGNYLKRFGYKKSSEIIMYHLDRVVGLCRKEGLRPMIWSDMLFRSNFNGKYFISEGEIPKETLDRIPQDVDLVYWDYYTVDTQCFKHMVHCHQQTGNNLVFAGGAWKWSGMVPHNRLSADVADVQLSICLEQNIDEVIVTAWGDDGAEASHFSVLPTLLYYAEFVAQRKKPDAERLNARSEECFGINYEDFLNLDIPNILPACPKNREQGMTNRQMAVNPSRYMLFNDPLLGLLDQHIEDGDIGNVFESSAQKLSHYGNHPEFGYLFQTLSALCAVLSEKATLGIDLRKAYHQQNREELATIANCRIPKTINEVEKLIDVFRKQWQIENKPFGFEVQDIRLGGLIQRLKATSLTIHQYLDGELTTIEEFEQKTLPFTQEFRNGTPYVRQQLWKKYVTAGVI